MGSIFYNNTTATINTNGVVYGIENNASMVEYIDYMCEILGIDMTYDKYKEMSEEERLQFLRNQKLKKLI